jgi:hypothetical protein
MVVGAAALLIARHAGASTFVMLDEAQLAARSVAAVRGTVTAIESGYDVASAGVRTYVRIARAEDLFGALPAGDIVLREIGGRAGGVSEWVYGSAEYRVGEEVVVFLTATADGALRTTAMAMGKFAVIRDGAGVATAVRTLGEGATVWDLERGELIERPGPEEYALDGMRDALREAAIRWHEKHLEAPRGVRLVPAELTRVRLREARATFTYLSTPSRWFEPDDGTPIGFLIDGTGDVGLGPATSRAAITDAFAAWTSASGSDLALVDAGTLAAPLSFAGCTGGNRIVFNDPFNEITDPTACGGVLAIGGFCASSETRTVNGTSFRRIRIGKVTFNNGWSSCAAWNRCNLAEVATHELGHALGFGHSSDANATMYASAHFDGRCAGLRTDDLNGLTFVYPSAASPTPTPSPATASATATASPTRTLTATAPSATSTATRTATATPAAPTATASRTATVPAATATTTHTLPPTAPPTPTATPPPTGTATASATATATRTPRPGHRVRGRVRYYAGDEAVPDVTVRLTGDGAAATATSATGDYEFADVVDGSWEVGAEKAGDIGHAVSPLDAAFILQHIAQLRQLDATQRLACDVTGDGQLSTLDATRVLQFSVGQTARLPVADVCGGDWLFAADPSSAPSAVDPTVGSGTCSSGKIILDNLTAEADEQNFRALLFGDCTGNWQSAMAARLDARAGRGGAHVRLGRLAVRDGRARVPVHVRSGAPFSALDLEVAYDATRLTPTGARLRRPAESAIVTTHVAVPGSLRVALASGAPLGRRRGVLLILEFAPGDRIAGDPVRAITASIDEQPVSTGGTR